MIASVGKPAVVTASASTAAAASADAAPRVVVHVTGYQPPQQGAVRGVVKVQKADGSEQEIGSFGMFPNTAFKAEASRPRSFGFALPKELATGAVKLKVEIVPDKGSDTGEGARLEVGRAEVQ